MNAVYLGNNRVLVKPVWGGLLILPSDDLSLTPTLITQGIFEPHLTKYLINTLRPGHVAFDVGANLGYYTVLMSRLVGEKGKVVAYEANPAMYSLLRDNISANYLRNQAKARLKAVYSEPATLTFHVSERFPCNSSIFEREENYLEDHVDTFREIQVEAEPLDVHIDQFDSIDLIKMDIEGGEYHAFLGMQKLLRKSVIDSVVFEWAPTMLREHTAPFCDLLRSMAPDYGFFRLSAEGQALPVSLDQVFARAWVPSVLMKRMA